MNIYEFTYRAMRKLRLLQYLPDEAYLRLAYRYRLRQKLNLDNPKSFNEKLQWLKLEDRKPIYTTMVDKYEAKKFVAERIGESYIIPTLGVWDHFDEIDFRKLPDQFVLKCTHDSGGLVICRDKSALDMVKTRNKLEACLARNYYLSSREWPYKDVKPRIIAEQYLYKKSGGELSEYKLMCFNGKVLCSYVCTGRYSEKGLCTSYYDCNWKPMPFERTYPRDSKEIPRPQCYEEMVHCAEILSEGISFLRVDFYELNGKIYLGELTFFPGSGMGEFRPEKWDRKLGDYIHLPNVK